MLEGIRREFSPYDRSVDILCKQAHCVNCLILTAGGGGVSLTGDSHLLKKFQEKPKQKVGLGGLVGTFHLYNSKGGRDKTKEVRMI